MTHWFRHLLRMMLALALAAAGLRMAQAAPAAGPYWVDWWSADHSGGGPLTGGAYTLNASAGQADAGARSGGSYTQPSGYWVIPADASSVLSITLDSVPVPGSKLRIGHEITYTVRVTLTDAVLARAAEINADVLVTATIPARTVYVAGSAAPAATTVLPDQVQWLISESTARAGFTATYRVRVIGASRSIVAVATADGGGAGVTQVSNRVELSTVEYVLLPLLAFE